MFALRTMWLSAAVFLLLSPLARAQEPVATIKLAADNWCPFTCDANASDPGFMVEIAQAIFKKYNIAVEYKTVSWARAIQMAADGKIDGIIGAAKGDAPDFIFPSTLQGMSEMTFWVKKDSNWQYDSIASLGKVRMGVSADYSYGKILDLYLKMHRGESDHIQEINNADALSINLRKLNAGMIDALPEDRNVINYYFSSRGLNQNVKAAGIVIDRANMEDNYLHIAFGPTNPKARQYAEMVTRGTQELRRSGELKKILDKYKVDDWYARSGK